MEDIGHATTPEDAAYVRAEFATLEELVRGRRVPIATARGWAGTALPRATYTVPDGELLFARDWWRLADEAGTVDAVRAEFERRLVAAMRALDHAVDPEDEWRGYLAGLYGACLHAATPENIVAKARLVVRIERAVAAPRADDPGWQDALRTDVDALDGLVRRFAACDRERFGRPTSRDRLITAVRAAYPAAFITPAAG